MYVCDYLLRTDQDNESTGTQTTILRISLSSLKYSPDFNQRIRRRLANTFSKTRGMYGRIPSKKHEASIRPRTNALSNVHGRIPAHNHGASIRIVVDEYPLRNMGQVIVLWTNTLSGMWGKYSSADEYHRTYSTNGFPDYSSNLFVFVRGLQN